EPGSAAAAVWGGERTARGGDSPARGACDPATAPAAGAWTAAEGAAHPSLPAHRPGARDHHRPPDGAPHPHRPTGEGRVAKCCPPNKKSWVSSTGLVDRPPAKPCSPYRQPMP